MKDKTVKILQELFLFKDVNEKIDFLKLGEIKPFKKGEIIYGEEHFEKALAVLLSGKAEADEKSGGATLCSFCEGSVFAATAVFCDEKDYISKIIAKSDCEILFISEEKLSELFSAHPKICVNYISFLNRKIRFLNEKISVFTSGSVEARVLKYFAENNDQKQNMSAVSNQLGIGRTSLYRALNVLEEKNLIVRNDGKVCVL